MSIFRLLFLTLFLCLNYQAMAEGSNIDFRSMNDLSPNDYLFGAYGQLEDPTFDKYRTVDLNVVVELI